MYGTLDASDSAVLTMAVPLGRLAVPPVYVVTLKDVGERPICEAQVYPEQFSFLQGMFSKYFLTY